MKHPAESAEARLASLLAQAGISVAEAAQAEMLAYLRAVLIANAAVNLTAIDEFDSALRLHIVDSLVALPELLESPSGVMLDLGSGGGFPGVPLMLATGRRVVLLDSVKKKGAAVSALLQETLRGRPIEVMSERAEDHSKRHGARYAVVVARAVAPLASILELASPLLCSGGMLVALKGSPEDSEVTSGARVASIVGFGRLSMRQVTLPGGSERRTIVSANKIRESKIPLPRRNGLAQKSPLA